MTRGYFGIGISHGKTAENVGTLVRSAAAFGAAFVFVVGRRFRKQASDVWSSSKHVPVYEYVDVDDLRRHLPYSCPLVGVELDDRARPLATFHHPERAVYLLGAEDHGLTLAERAACHHLVYVEGAAGCLNVATAGSIVLYDRSRKAAS